MRAADAEGPVASECEVRRKDGADETDAAGDTSMGLPEVLRIGAFDFSVRELTELEVEKNGCWGHLDTDIFELAYAPHSPPQRQVETVLHECMHGLLRGYSGELKPELEERIVKTLGMGLMALIRDNPEMIAWVYKKLGFAP